MVRKVDEAKIQKILDNLKKHPEGTYVSEIARETGLPKSTVSYMLAKHLSDRTEEIISGRKGLFKIFKLR